MEVLTSYGWMILVLGVVAGALTYMGVFDSTQYLPQQCDLGFDFSCERFIILDNGTVRIEATNQAGKPLIIESFTCIYSEKDSHTTPYNKNWGPTETVRLECNPYTPPGLNPDERANIDVRLEYRKKDGGFTKSQEGRVATNVRRS